MRIKRSTLRLIAAAACFTLSEGCDGGGGGDRISEAEKDEECFRDGLSPLVRPVGAQETGARGRLIHCSRGNGTTLRIRAELLPPGLEVGVLLEDVSGALQPLSTGTVSDAGKLTLRLADRVVGVNFVEGSAVALVDAAIGSVLLEGVIASIFQKARPVSRTKRLVNEDRVFAPRGVASVAVEFPQATGMSRFEIEVANVPADSELDVLLENPDTGSLEAIATIRVDSTSEGELRYDTELGEALPFRVPFVSDLFDLEIELRSLGGELRFSGAVPSPKL